MNFRYLKYILRHKYFVFVAGRWVGASFWRSLIHDWSKLFPGEFRPYAKHFYGSSKTEETELAYKGAWNHHQKLNKHHWQYWVYTQDSGGEVILPMPEKYMLEMIADWMGAGRAITGKWDISGWYAKNKDKINIHPDTRRKVEENLDIICTFLLDEE